MIFKNLEMKKNYISPAIRIKSIATDSLLQQASGKLPGDTGVHDSGNSGDAGEADSKPSMNTWDEE